MTTSIITKKRIAKAFKKQMIEKSFEKISVVDIMDQAKIRRQTFYNHFVDKFELLDWIFETELQEQITNNLNYITGFKLLEELLFYIESNRIFYQQLFQIEGQNDFYSFFRDYCFILMEKIISEEEDQENQLEKHIKTFLIQYHTNALAISIKDYVCQLSERPDILTIKHIILASLK